MGRRSRAGNRPVFNRCNRSYKRAGSLLYGSDAIGGVINLNTNYIPQQDFGGSVNLFTRTNNESYGISAQLQGRQNKFFYKTQFTLIDYGDYKVPADSIQYYSYYIKLKDRRLRNTAGKEQNFRGSFGWLSDRFKSIFNISNVYAKSGFFADAHGLEVRLSDIDYDKSSRDIDYPYHSANHFKAANTSSWYLGDLFLKVNLSYQNNYMKELVERFHMDICLCRLIIWNGGSTRIFILLICSWIYGSVKNTI